MFESHHSYDGKYEGSLGFEIGQKFLSLRKENEYWSLVVDQKSDIGYVPNNCMKEIFNCDPEITLSFIDNGFRALTSKKASQIKKLEFIFKELVTLRTVILDSREQIQTNQSHRDVPNLFSQGSSMKLIDILRKKTGLDYFVCMDSLYSMTDALITMFPSIKHELTLIKTDLVDYETSHSVNNQIIRQCFDAKLIEKYLTFIEKRLDNKHDSEWNPHEDYYDVKKNLNDLLAVVFNSNPNVIRMKIKERDYRIYEMLVEMYRDEKRFAIRTLILLCIVGLCQVDENCLRFISSSFLPMELIREIQQLSPIKNQSHYITCLRVMSMLLAYSKDVSVQVISGLSKSFFRDLLLKISPEGVFLPEENAENLTQSNRPVSIADLNSVNLSNLSIEEKYFLGQLEDAAFSFIVAANKHMPIEERMSPLVESIKENLSLSKKILENLLVNFNWENDVTLFDGLKLINSLPSDLKIDKRHFIDKSDNLISQENTSFQRTTAMSDLSKRDDAGCQNIQCLYVPKHPTRRFLFDLMRHSDMVSVFYRNDIEVAMRILLRHISDLSDDKELLMEYLSILEILLSNIIDHHSNLLSCHLSMINETMDLVKERAEEYLLPTLSQTRSPEETGQSQTIKDILAKIDEKLAKVY